MGCHTGITISVVTVSKFSFAVGFGRFFGKKTRFRIQFWFFGSISIIRTADSCINPIVHKNKKQ